MFVSNNKQIPGAFFFSSHKEEGYLFPKYHRQRRSFFFLRRKFHKVPFSLSVFCFVAVPHDPDSSFMVKNFTKKVGTL